MSCSIWIELKPRQEVVESALQASLSRVTGSAPPSLVEAMAYSLLAPGKRVRPLLTLLACEAVGRPSEPALAAAAAVEMVHTYSLVHDDLPAMDDDDLRRGLPTCHKKFGEATAILVGDALLTGAFELLSGSYDAATAAVTTLELAKAAGAGGMVGGQVLDLTAEGRVPGPAPATLRDLEAIHRRKTGALFRAALRNGVHVAMAGNAAEAQLRAIDEYAEGFGLAFQITDDLLDVESSAEKTGKRVGKDAGRGKLTYPGLVGVEESRRAAAKCVGQAVQAVEPFGTPGRLLADLARYLTTRDR